MNKDKFTIGAFAIILDKEDRILLCHRRDRDIWNLPGGSLEKGESPWECVKREVKEETGLDVKIVRLVGIYSKPNKDEIVFQFLCEPTGGKLKLNDEADKIEYFTCSRIPKNTVVKQIERIKFFLERREEMILKIQN